jgi:hypothetical protein
VRLPWGCSPACRAHCRHACPTSTARSQQAHGTYPPFLAPAGVRRVGHGVISFLLAVAAERGGPGTNVPAPPVRSVQSGYALPMTTSCEHARSALARWLQTSYGWAACASGTWDGEGRDRCSSRFWDGEGEPGHAVAIHVDSDCDADDRARELGTQVRSIAWRAWDAQNWQIWPLAPRPASRLATACIKRWVAARASRLPAGSSLRVLIEAVEFLVALGQSFRRLPGRAVCLIGCERFVRSPRRAPACGLCAGWAAVGQAGGAKNSRAIPSGSRKETPEP